MNATESRSRSMSDPNESASHHSGARIPTYTDLLWPTLQALKTRGGSASIRELEDDIASSWGLSEEILEISHGDGPQSEINYRSAWARTHLKFLGAIDNTSRGVWAITDDGRSISTEAEVLNLNRQQRARRTTGRTPRPKRPTPIADDETNDRTWHDELLDVLRSMGTDAFERLCQRILRESGFTKVEVTGRSGDGGIDGAGVLRVNLLSFHVRFQCKRYSGSVRAHEVRDFRGAMVGRADKGLFITTGRFTGDAEREAVRDGAPAIDLIDGLALCDLLKDLRLGITTETVEVSTVDPTFFASM